MTAPPAPRQPTLRHLCRRCGHAWIPRASGTPKQCPKCRHPRWWTDIGAFKLGRPLGAKDKKPRKQADRSQPKLTEAPPSTPPPQVEPPPATPKKQGWYAP